MYEFFKVDDQADRLSCRCFLLVWTSYRFSHPGPEDPRPQEQKDQDQVQGPVLAVPLYLGGRRCREGGQITGELTTKLVGHSYAHGADDADRV